MHIHICCKYGFTPENKQLIFTGGKWPTGAPTTIDGRFITPGTLLLLDRVKGQIPLKTRCVLNSWNAFKEGSVITPPEDRVIFSSEWYQTGIDETRVLSAKIKDLDGSPMDAHFNQSFVAMSLLDAGAGYNWDKKILPQFLGDDSNRMDYGPTDLNSTHNILTILDATRRFSDDKVTVNTDINFGCSMKGIFVTSDHSQSLTLYRTAINLSTDNDWEICSMGVWGINIETNADIVVVTYTDQATVNAYQKETWIDLEESLNFAVSFSSGTHVTLRNEGACSVSGCSKLPLFLTLSQEGSMSYTSMGPVAEVTISEKNSGLPLESNPPYERYMVATVPHQDCTNAMVFNKLNAKHVAEVSVEEFEGRCKIVLGAPTVQFRLERFASRIVFQDLVNPIVEMMATSTVNYAIEYVGLSKDTSINMVISKGGTTVLSKKIILPRSRSYVTISTKIPSVLLGLGSHFLSVSFSSSEPSVVFSFSDTFSIYVVEPQKWFDFTVSALEGAPSQPCIALINLSTLQLNAYDLNLNSGSLLGRYGDSVRCATNESPCTTTLTTSSIPHHAETFTQGNSTFLRLMFTSDSPHFGDQFRYFYSSTPSTTSTQPGLGIYGSTAPLFATGDRGQLLTSDIDNPDMEVAIPGPTLIQSREAPHGIVQLEGGSFLSDGTKTSGILFALAPTLMMAVKGNQATNITICFKSTPSVSCLASGTSQKYTMALPLAASRDTWQTVSFNYVSAGEWEWQAESLVRDPYRAVLFSTRHVTSTTSLLSAISLDTPLQFVYLTNVTSEFLVTNADYATSMIEVEARSGYQVVSKEAPIGTQEVSFNATFQEESSLVPRQSSHSTFQEKPSLVSVSSKNIVLKVYFDPIGAYLDISTPSITPAPALQPHGFCSSLASCYAASTDYSTPVVDAQKSELSSYDIAVFRENDLITATPTSKVKLSLALYYKTDNTFEISSSSSSSSIGDPKPLLPARVYVIINANNMRATQSFDLKPVPQKELPLDNTTDEDSIGPVVVAVGVVGALALFGSCVAVALLCKGGR